jgi:hypothetical protein
MALTLPWDLEMMGLTASAAYVRLHRLTRSSAPDASGSMRLGSTLHAEFLVYASEAARNAARDHIGNIAVRVESPDWTADLGPQAYAALKARYPDGVDR